jgi:hypothetical protein
VRSGLHRGRTTSLLASTVAAVVAFCVGTGCYRTVAAAPTAFTPGSTVHLVLTPQGETDLAPRLGPETIAVEGRVDSVGSGGVALVVSRTRKRTGATIPWIGERVTIPAAAIAQSQQRTLDRRRSILTGVLAGAATIAALAVLIAQHGAGSGDEGGGPVGPTP